MKRRRQPTKQLEPVAVDVLVDIDLSIEYFIFYNRTWFFAILVDQLKCQNIASDYLILFWIGSKQIDKSDSHAYLSHHLCLVITLHPHNNCETIKFYISLKYSMFTCSNAKRSKVLLLDLEVLTLQMYVCVTEDMILNKKRDKRKSYQENSIIELWHTFLTFLSPLKFQAYKTNLHLHLRHRGKTMRSHVWLHELSLSLVQC